MKRRFFLAGLIAAPVVGVAAPAIAKTAERVTPNKLLIARTEALATRLRKALGLGDDWYVTGAYGALTGRRFDRVVLAGLDNDFVENYRWHEWFGKVVNTRAAKDCDWVAI